MHKFSNDRWRAFCADDCCRIDALIARLFLLRLMRFIDEVDSSNAKLRLAPAYLHVGDYERHYTLHSTQQFDLSPGTMRMGGWCCGGSVGP